MDQIQGAEERFIFRESRPNFGRMNNASVGPDAIVRPDFQESARYRHDISQAATQPLEPLLDAVDRCRHAVRGHSLHAELVSKLADLCKSHK